MERGEEKVRGHDEISANEFSLITIIRIKVFREEKENDEDMNSERVN